MATSVWHKTRLKANQSLFEAGDPAGAVYRVDGGILLERIPAETQYYSLLLPRNALFGLDSSISEFRLTSVVAAIDAEVSWCPYSYVKGEMSKNPAVKDALFLSLIARNYRICTELALTAYEGSDYRIRRAFLQFLDSTEQDEVNLRRKTLAEMTGVSSKTLIKAVSALEDRGVLEIDGGVIKVNDREKLRRISRVNDYFFNLDSILTTYETAFMALISGDQSDAAIIDRRDLQEKVRTFNEGITLGSVPAESPESRFGDLQLGLERIWPLIRERIRPDVIFEALGVDVGEVVPFLLMVPTRYPPAAIMDYLGTFGILSSVMRQVSQFENLDLIIPNLSQGLQATNIPATTMGASRQSASSANYKSIYQAIQADELMSGFKPGAVVRVLDGMLRSKNYDNDTVLTGAQKHGFWELIFPNLEEIRYKRGSIGDLEGQDLATLVDQMMSPREIEKNSRRQIGQVMRYLFSQKGMDDQILDEYGNTFFIPDDWSPPRRVTPQLLYEEVCNGTSLRGIRKMGNIPLLSMLSRFVEDPGYETEPVTQWAIDNDFWELHRTGLPDVNYHQGKMGGSVLAIAVPMIEGMTPPEDIERQLGWRIGGLIREMNRRDMIGEEVLVTYRNEFFMPST